MGGERSRGDRLPPERLRQRLALGRGARCSDLTGFGLPSDIDVRVRTPLVPGLAVEMLRRSRTPSVNSWHPSWHRTRNYRAGLCGSKEVSQMPVNGGNPCARGQSGTMRDGHKRFSRPPRSTAPAPLRLSGAKGLTWPARRAKPEIGARSASVKPERRLRRYSAPAAISAATQRWRSLAERLANGRARHPRAARRQRCCSS